jgi:hypothetical protein
VVISDSKFALLKKKSGKVIKITAEDLKKRPRSISSFCFKYGCWLKSEIKAVMVKI